MMLLFGGRPFMPADNGGVEGNGGVGNPPEFPPGPG